MADGIIFEKLGVQTATLITDGFRNSGNAMARRMGMPEYHYVVVPHPVANLTPEECKTRAAEYLKEIAEVIGLDYAAEEMPSRQQRTPAEQLPWPPGRSV